ncbi:hypothetical protein MMC24_004180 [Lignoscripta atroalba]|nr:hypothetical protein [Lignoscripta atroalba]
MLQKHSLFAILTALLLRGIPLVLAHGSEVHGDMSMDMISAGSSAISSGPGNASGTVVDSSVSVPQSYFAYHDFSSLLLAHIVLMTIGWLFILPISVMLSIARSRLALPIQLGFVLVNAIGLLLGKVYNDLTPNLYENSAHHTLGWVVTWIVSAQAVMGLIRAYGGSAEKEAAFLPLSVEAMAQHQEIHSLRATNPDMFPNDSGHGTDAASTRSHSPSSMQDFYEDETVVPESPRDLEQETQDLEKRGFLRNDTINRFFSHTITSTAIRRAMKYVSKMYDMVDRVILILGFAALASGVVTYGGLFRGNNIFNGLAHFVKGGIFFWYGLLTLGRCMGCFADRGWAWNVKPSAAIVGSRKANSPSAEFVESFLIFFYGSTNVFLEHLAAWGSAWSAQDLEHVSISIMFFGGGLCGMLIESRRIRDLLNATILSSPSTHGISSPPDSWQQPRTYGFSLNPLPGLIILLLGLMMSSHHQASMVSTMIHKQWGTLFVGAALARGVTYILTYLSPPTSVLPSRPPSELVVAFCLISGGLIFMASNKDMVGAMEAYDLNAMFVFTVVMGLTAFLMAWEILVLAIKGWAVGRKQRPLFVMRGTV